MTNTPQGMNSQEELRKDLRAFAAEWESPFNRMSMDVPLTHQIGEIHESMLDEFMAKIEARERAAQERLLDELEEAYNLDMSIHRWIHDKRQSLGDQ